MTAANHTLPNLDALNYNELKALILSQNAQIHSQHEQLLSKDEQLMSRDNEIAHLKLLIAKLRRMQFGRKSEKLAREIAQLELRLDELEATQAEKVVSSQATTVVTDAAPVAAKPARRPLPEHLPREVRKYLPKQEVCPDCGGKLKHLGEDVSEILEYVPGSLKVIQYVRPKLACACCDRIVQAEAPSRPIERSIAGPGLLAHVLASKYCSTCLYIVSRRSMRVSRLSWIARLWQSG
jgi:transposase